MLIALMLGVVGSVSCSLEPHLMLETDVEENAEGDSNYSYFFLYIVHLGIIRTCLCHIFIKYE